MVESLVSVIISTFNRPVEVLERAVNSVINQTYHNLEIFIINDCPENKLLVDEIKGMLNTINDDRIQYIVLDRNQGACVARNTGIELSKGEYICCLDDDDAWLPQKVESQLKAFTNSKIGLVYSPFFKIDQGEEKPQLIARDTVSGNVFDRMLYKNIAGGCSMTMFSRIAIEKCGMFDERLLASQDYDLYLRIAQKYEFVYVGEPLTYRYMSEESITKNFEKKRQGWEMFTQKYLPFYENNLDAYNYRVNSRVRDLLAAGYFKESLLYYKQAISIKPFSKYNFTEPIKGIGKFLGFKNTKDAKI